jgi:hypothetical protein
MPPQQSHRLLDVVDERLGFGAHGSTVRVLIEQGVEIVAPAAQVNRFDADGPQSATVARADVRGGGRPRRRR